MPKKNKFKEILRELKNDDFSSFRLNNLYDVTLGFLNDNNVDFNKELTDENFNRLLSTSKDNLLLRYILLKNLDDDFSVDRMKSLMNVMTTEETIYLIKHTKHISDNTIDILTKRFEEKVMPANRDCIGIMALHEDAPEIYTKEFMDYFFDEHLKNIEDYRYTPYEFGDSIDEHRLYELIKSKKSPDLNLVVLNNPNYAQSLKEMAFSYGVNDLSDIKAPSPSIADKIYDSLSQTLFDKSHKTKSEEMHIESVFYNLMNYLSVSTLIDFVYKCQSEEKYSFLRHMARNLQNDEVLSLIAHTNDKGVVAELLMREKIEDETLNALNKIVDAKQKKELLFKYMSSSFSARMNTNVYKEYLTSRIDLNLYKAMVSKKYIPESVIDKIYELNKTEKFLKKDIGLDILIKMRKDLKLFMSTPATQGCYILSKIAYDLMTYNGTLFSKTYFQNYENNTEYKNFIIDKNEYNKICKLLQKYINKSSTPIEIQNILKQNLKRYQDQYETNKYFIEENQRCFSKCSEGFHFDIDAFRTYTNEEKQKLIEEIKEQPKKTAFWIKELILNAIQEVEGHTYKGFSTEEMYYRLYETVDIFNAANDRMNELQHIEDKEREEDEYPWL